MLRLRAIAYPLRPFHVTSHHSPLQLVTRTVLPAGIVVTTSESVPGPLRRLTLAMTAADPARTARTGAPAGGACEVGPPCGAAFGDGSCAAAGGLSCARPGPTITAVAMMLSAALSALKWKGMRKAPRRKPPRSWSTARKRRVKPIRVTNLRPKISIPLHEKNLTLRPRPLRRPHRLIGARHAQHAGIVEAVADDLQSDRHSIRIVTGANRGRRLLGHVERCREADVLERMRRVVAGRRLLGSIGGDRRGRRDEEIIRLGRCHGFLAHQHHQRQVARRIGRAQLFRPTAPGSDERQHLLLVLPRQELEFRKQAGLEETVKAG